MQPEVLLLDEPTNGLDSEAEARLVALLQRLPQAMLIVSHDPRLVQRLAGRAVILNNGSLGEASLHAHPQPDR